VPAGGAGAAPRADAAARLNLSVAQRRWCA
jgi:hypothetical protein